MAFLHSWQREALFCLIHEIDLHHSGDQGPIEERNDFKKSVIDKYDLKAGHGGKVTITELYNAVRNHWLKGKVSKTSKGMDIRLFEHGSQVFDERQLTEWGYSTWRRLQVDNHESQAHIHRPQPSGSGKEKVASDGAKGFEQSAVPKDTLAVSRGNIEEVPHDIEDEHQGPGKGMDGAKHGSQLGETQTDDVAPEKRKDDDSGPGTTSSLDQHPKGKLPVTPQKRKTEGEAGEGQLLGTKPQQTVSGPRTGAIRSQNSVHEASNNNGKKKDGEGEEDNAVAQKHTKFRRKDQWSRSDSYPWAPTPPEMGRVRVYRTHNYRPRPYLNETPFYYSEIVGTEINKPHILKEEHVQEQMKTFKFMMEWFISEIKGDDAELETWPEPSLDELAGNDLRGFYETLSGRDWRFEAFKHFQSRRYGASDFVHALLGAAAWNFVWSKPLPWEESLTLALAEEARIKFYVELEHLQRAKFRRIKDKNFQTNHIEPAAKDFARRFMTAMLRQFHRVGVWIRDKSDSWDRGLRRLEEMFSHLLMLKAKMEASCEEYVVEWVDRGEPLHRVQMLETRETEGEQKVAWCVSPSICRLFADEDGWWHNDVKPIVWC